MAPAPAAPTNVSAKEGWGHFDTHNVGSTAILVLAQERHHRNTLHRLPKTHLVSEQPTTAPTEQLFDAAPLEADVGALLSATVDAVPPAAARAWLRYLDERGHARLAVFEAQELRERRRRTCLLGLEDLE